MPPRLPGASDQVRADQIRVKVTNVRVSRFVAELTILQDQQQGRIQQTMNLPRNEMLVRIETEPDPGGLAYSLGPQIWIAQPRGATECYFPGERIASSHPG
jgi:hypothetical protein